MNKIVAWFHRLSMYQAVLYGLVAIVGYGLIVSFSSNFFFTPLQFIASVGLLIISSLGSNLLLAKVYRVASNEESSLITALILACIVPAPTTGITALITMLIGCLAMLVKYLLAVRGRHLVNPAAFAAVAIGLLGLSYADWWVGSIKMFPLVLVLSLAVLYKIERLRLVGWFFLGLVGSSLVSAQLLSEPFLELLQVQIISGPAIFFAAFMLTEPRTLPPDKSWQASYAGLVGVLSASVWSIGPLYSTPELALVVGNVAASLVNTSVPRVHFVELLKLSDRYYELVLRPTHQFKYMAGQYAEITLAGIPGFLGGNRRMFTIASSPTEPLLRFGMSIPKNPSAFKQGVLKLNDQSQLVVGGLGGAFTLPEKESVSMLWLAGGIGITPFRSMAQYIRDSEKAYSVQLLHFVSTEQDAVFADTFKDSNRSAYSGIPISKDLLREVCVDVQTRIIYIAGSPNFVRQAKEVVNQLGIPANRIITDQFSGY